MKMAEGNKQASGAVGNSIGFDGPHVRGRKVASGAVRMSSGARIEITTRGIHFLDTQRLTVLALLLSIGLTAGLTLGFGIGGLPGVAAGIVGGFGFPLLLALAFRNPRLRNGLAAIADWATERTQ